MYRIANLSKRHEGSRQPALNGVDLEIPRGSLFGLLGPNGAGKSTLLAIMLGLTKQSSGEVLFDGANLHGCLSRVRRVVALVPQDLAFYPMLTARENLRFFVSLLDLPAAEQRQRIEFAVATTGLEHDLDKRAQHFSGGLQRRLNLAIGLLSKPEVLCLDEPTVGIDPHSRNFILAAIKTLNQQGMTIVYTSHYMEEVQRICDRVAIIDRGRIVVSDTVDHLLHGGVDATLTIVLSGPVAKVVLAKLPPEPGLQAIDECTLQGMTPLPLPLLQAVAAAMAGTDDTIDRIRYGRRELEQIFIAFTECNE